MIDTSELDKERAIAASKKQEREWFILRFGKLPEQDPVYYDEWRTRFREGKAWRLMDYESRKKWLVVEGSKRRKIARL